MTKVGHKTKWNPCYLCCIKVRTGCEVVATLEIVGYSLGILLFSLVGSMYRTLTHSLSSRRGEIIGDGGVIEQLPIPVSTTIESQTVDSSNIRNFRFQLLFTLSLVSVCGLFGGILLALGLKFKSTGGTFFFKFWMALKSIQCLAIIVLIIVDLTRGFWDLKLPYFVSWLVLSLYFFVVVIMHHYYVIKDAGRRESLQYLHDDEKGRRSFGKSRPRHFIDDEGEFEEEDRNSGTSSRQQISRQHTIDMDIDDDEITNQKGKRGSGSNPHAIAPHA